MSFEVCQVGLPDWYRYVLTSVTETEGIVLEDYLAQAMGMGALCCDTFLENRLSEIETYVVLEYPDGTVNRREFSSFFPQGNTAQAMDLLIDNPFGSFDAKMKVSLIGQPENEAAHRAELLEIGLDDYMELCVNLRWNLTQVKSEGGTFAIRCGKSDTLELDF